MSLTSHSSRLGTTVYNGELYDWPKASYTNSRTTGDTEVIHKITCVVPTELKRASGMHAIATWRARDGSLVLARDPAGEKALYIVRQQGWLAFASELRALVGVRLLTPDISRDVSRERRVSLYPKRWRRRGSISLKVVLIGRMRG